MSSIQKIKKEYYPVFWEIACIINKYDFFTFLAGIDFPEEYDIEVASIIPRLKNAESADDTVVILKKVLGFWFSVYGENIFDDIWSEDEAIREIQEAHFRTIAEKIWFVWQKFQRGEYQQYKQLEKYGEKFDEGYERGQYPYLNCG